MRSGGTVNQIFEWHRRVPADGAGVAAGRRGKGTVRGGNWVYEVVGIERRYPGHKTSVATGHAGTLLRVHLRLSAAISTPAGFPRAT